MKGISETIKNETKEQKWWLLSIFLRTLVSSLLGYALTGRGTGEGSERNRWTGKGTIRERENFYCRSIL